MCTILDDWGVGLDLHTELGMNCNVRWGKIFMPLYVTTY